MWPPHHFHRNSYKPSNGDNGAKNSMDLLVLLCNLGMAGDVDFLREAPQALVQSIMGTEAPAQIGTRRGEVNPERPAHRNAHLNRPWDTWVRTMGLAIPEIREGSHFPCLLELRRRIGKALPALIQRT